MKKILVISTVALLSSLSIFAQLAIKPAIGVNFTDWSKDQVTGEFKSKVGYQIGGTIAIGGHIYFEPGIFYVQKSTEFVSDVSGANNTDYNLKGVRIPATVGINLLGSQKGLLNVRAFGGASVFFLTNADGNSNITKDDFKDASWGLFAGAGASVSMFFVDAQYEWSLTDITKTSVDVGKTRTIFINAGIKIGL
jgi:hypothetical protein